MARGTLWAMALDCLAAPRRRSLARCFRIIDSVSYGNIRTRPDLSPLFGPVRKQDNDRILDLLLQIDDQLSALAQVASQHVGVPYKHTGLGFFAGMAGAEIAGGPSGEAGDIWFEIQNT